MTVETKPHEIILMSKSALKCSCGTIKKVPKDEVQNAMDWLLDWHKDHKEGKE